MPDRIVTCRMTNRHGNRCTAEAIDPNGEVLICIRHYVAVCRTVREAQARVARTAT
ncbi:hypothetical protein [Streptomyces enissocaesilis]|uniref:DUF1540 domain-containing protein n=1 Tax=Streptomyces enissocaesilis TaxID=332589 RepID=A0ABP6K7P6_9ACTN